ncbi:MAG: heat-inducible transcriptional repressor HrcA [Tenericutes bacterium]|nr:heat-inducible transcriptional repressor HrcA [Mycoplasmatota bacterium]
MLNDRRRNILKIIVEDYIKTARPVGSGYVAKKLNCSSATVRNEMMYLEEVGLLEKTHISSGRVPSEKGYRYYVDELMTPKDMTGEDMLKLQTIFKNNTLVLSDVIKKSIEIVTEITNYTSVVLGNTSSINRLKKVEVIPLGDNKIITMIITDKGHVEHKMMIIPSNISSLEVKQTVDLINKLLIGTPIDEISSKLEFEVKPIIPRFVKEHEVLYDAFYNAFNEFSTRSSDVQFIGKNNFLKQPEFNNIEKVKEILNNFEDIDKVSKMEEEDNGINIYIGNESELSPDVAVIKTKYNYNGEEGTIAIIGPKRMEYDKVVGILNYIRDNIDIS